jgi:hypothetical protein
MPNGKPSKKACGVQVETALLDAWGEAVVTRGVSKTRALSALLTLFLRLDSRAQASLMTAGDADLQSLAIALQEALSKRGKGIAIIPPRSVPTKRGTVMC